MDKPVIAATGLGKRYTLGDPLMHNTLRDHIAGAANSLLKKLRQGAGKQAAEAEEFWALRDVGFEIGQGEAVGIIGHNGAGKSTLLKVLSQITEPTTGEIRMRGRVASLLEVGTGFHPELSGRENIFMNGAILGMTRREIQTKFDEIVAFAEVEKFIDTPVKRYSSGMYVRLAFAVAAHLEPEILLVDEVLAVGDVVFQRKCLGKMEGVARQGRTVLFVSHNLSAMRSLCRRVIWLDHGRVREDGEADQVVNQYVRETAKSTPQRSWTLEDAPGTDVVKLLSAKIVSGGDDPEQPLTVSNPITVEYCYQVLRDGVFLHLATHMMTPDRLVLFVANNAEEKEWFGRPHPAGVYKTRMKLPAFLLNDGGFRLRLLILKDGAEVQCNLEDLLVFEVADDAPEMRIAYFGKWLGLVRPRLQWETEKVN